MSLLKSCEPVFRRVCELQREARRRVQPAYEPVRTELKGLIDELHIRIQNDAQLRHAANPPEWGNAEVRVARTVPFLPDPPPMQLGENGPAPENANLEPVTSVELALAHFVDDLMSQPVWKFHAQWQAERLGNFYNQLAGGAQFYLMLVAELVIAERRVPDAADDASERLAFYYICLGLGFNGSPGSQRARYPNFPITRQAWTLRIQPHIRQHLSVPDPNPFCPAAYENVDTRQLAPRSWRDRLTTAVALSVILCLAIWVTSALLYKNDTENLTKFVEVIKTHVP